jgi:hypothetical protein
MAAAAGQVLPLLPKRNDGSGECTAVYAMMGTVYASRLSQARPPAAAAAAPPWCLRSRGRAALTRRVTTGHHLPLRHREALDAGRTRRAPSADDARRAPAHPGRGRELGHAADRAGSLPRYLAEPHEDHPKRHGRAPTPGRAAPVRVAPAPRLSAPWPCRPRTSPISLLQARARSTATDGARLPPC